VLVERGANVNAAWVTDGMSVLMLASMRDMRRQVPALMGARVSLRGSQGLLLSVGFSSSLA
jgi:hypothetical protein